ncbi:MAG TPA: glycosyl transferase, partial [Beijerinckiaceae bacterium]|nr:glycosyl transferase [Beijerinckiaceae bacterium]
AVGCDKPALASAGYREPSLVFLTRTDLRLVMGAEAANILAQDGPGCRIAFVESREEASFRAALAAKPAGETLTTRIRGVNINGGRTLDIGVYVRR